MISGPRSRSGVPLDEQSALPTAPGVPWWGAVLLAVGLTSVGAVIVVAGDGATLGFSFKAFYVIGCIAAVLAVRRRALFTAVAQPPLILFGVAVITLYFLVSGADSGLRKVIFNVALPVAKLFPLMGWTFLIVLAIAGARVWLTHPSNAGKVVKTGDRKASTAPKKAATTSGPRTTNKARAAGDKPRPAKSTRPQPRPAALDDDVAAPAAAVRPRASQVPRPPVPTTDPRPRASEPRVSERGDDRIVPPPRRRRAAPDVPPEARPRRAAPYGDLPPQPGARAYRSPEDFIYAPPPRLRDRDPDLR